MEINLDDLQKICDRLFQYTRARGVDSVTLEVDYYWNIPQEERYNPYKQPSELDLGQLSDDWNELQKIIQSQEELLGYSFVWLSTIMRAIGERLIL